MADEDQQQKKPLELPGNFFDRPQPGQAAPVEVPPNFFSMPFEQQRQYLQEPGTLPEDMPERTLKTAGRAAPYVAATAAALATPEFGLPWWGSLLAGGGITGLATAGGSLAQSGIYSAIGDPEAPATLEEAVKRAGIEGAWGAGTEIGMRGAGLALGKVLGKMFDPRSMYQRALKPPAGRGQRVSGELVETGLREKIPLTHPGAERLAKTIEGVNKDIEQTIAASPTDIPAQDYVTNIQKRFDILRKKYGRRALSGGIKGSAVETINEAERRFLINHGNVTPLNVFKGRNASGQPVYQLLEPEKMNLNMLRARAKPLSTLDAQAVKRETYEELRAIYKARGQNVNIPGWGPGTHPDLVTEATQELTRALREELGNIYPGLHALNERDGRLIDLDEAVNRYLNREGNRGLWRWGAAMLSGGTLAAERLSGRDQGIPALIGLTSTALIKGALDDPAISSYLAIALEGARKMPGKGIALRLGREALPTAARYEEYLSREGYPPVRVIDPSELEVKAAPAPVPSAAEPPPEQIRPGDRPFYERERGMRGRRYPLYGWTPEWVGMLNSSSRTVGVPLAELHAIAAQEASGGQAAEKQRVPANLVRSDKNAIGLMQVRPQTAARFGYSEKDLEDPQKNIDAAARFVKYLNAKPEFRAKPALVLAAYYAGEGAVARANNKLYNMSKEVQDYVREALKTWSQVGLPPGQAELFMENIPER